MKEATESTVAPAISEEALQRWTWEDAQARLSEAYAVGGLGHWTEVALREMEIEAELLRRQRALEQRSARFVSASLRGPS